MVIIGLSCVPVVRCRQPHGLRFNVVSPGAMWLTTIRLGFPGPFEVESPPYQMFPGGVRDGHRVAAQSG